MKETRTRFAPSPTGFMHVGNLRTTIFSYLIAKRNNGKFILRIEDTDQTRQVEGAIDFIYDTLKLCDIKIDEGPNNAGAVGPYIQSERLEIYQTYAHKLVEENKAYICFCDEERLNELREEATANKIAFLYDRKCKDLPSIEVAERIKNGEKYVIRQAMPTTGVTIYDDLVFGKISVDNKILEDQILLKSDGYPTYNFANVVDDHLMNITDVVRGNEYLMSTPKYNLLYDAFGFEKPNYIHVAMVLGSDGQKLSKRNGDASFMDLYNLGYIPEAIVNYLVLLGWSPESNQEIFSLDELIKEFDPTRISKSPSTFDLKKLNWVNAHYVKKLDLESLLKITVPHLEKAYDLSSKTDEWVKHLVSIYQNHISFGNEIVDETSLFFNESIILNEECQEFMNQDGVATTINVFKEEIEKIEDWTVENISNAINMVKEKANVKGKMLFMPLRIKVSGLMHGPELPDTIYLIGKETILSRCSK